APLADLGPAGLSSERDDRAGDLVALDQRQLRGVVVLPDVEVGPAQGHMFDLNEDFACTWFGPVCLDVFEGLGRNGAHGQHAPTSSVLLSESVGPELRVPVLHGAFDVAALGEGIGGHGRLYVLGGFAADDEQSTRVVAGGVGGATDDEAARIEQALEEFEMLGTMLVAAGLRVLGIGVGDGEQS